MIKKIILLIIILFTSLCTSSCFDFKDINRTVFVTAILVDIDNFNNPILYVETFISSRGDVLEVGKETKNISVSRASSLFDAKRNLTLTSKYTFDYTQCRAVIFTTKAASFGLDNFLDFFDRGQEIPQRFYVFITPATPDKLLGLKMDEGIYVGIFLSELAQESRLSSQGTTLRIDEFFNNRYTGSKVNLVNIVDLQKDQVTPRLSITNLAVLKDDVLVSTLTDRETRAYNLLNNTYKFGIIYATNPEHRDKQTVLDILKSRTKTQLYFDGHNLQLKKKINEAAIFGYTEKSIKINNPEEKNFLQEDAENNTKTICQDLFDKYKKKNIDIFNIQREFEMKYPKTKIDNCIQITDLDLEVNINIKGSTNTTDFK